MSGKNLVYQSVIVSTFQAEQNKEYFVLLWKGSKLLLRLWKCSQYLSCLSIAGHVTMLLFNCKTHRLSCRSAEGYSFFSNVLLLDHCQGNIASKTFRPLAVISLMSVSQNSHSVKLITQGEKDWGYVAPAPPYLFCGKHLHIRRLRKLMFNLWSSKPNEN